MIELRMEQILPLLPGLAPLIEDPEVSEIAHNGDGRVFVERRGKMTLVPGLVLDQSRLVRATQMLASGLSTVVDHNNPLMDGRLADGSRIAVALPPVSQGGVTLTIRKFDSRRFTLEQLIRMGSVSPDTAEQLIEKLKEQHNILISGGTSTGKTTLLNALSQHLGDDRIVLIEDTAEVQLHQENVVRLVSHREEPAVPIRDLIKAAMRLRPDRIIVGEVRGAEAFDLLQALNSGHGGSLATIHAQSAMQALRKLATYVLQSGDLAHIDAINEMIISSIQTVVQLAKDKETGARYVAEVGEVLDYDRKTGIFEVELWEMGE